MSVLRLSVVQRLLVRKSEVERKWRVPLLALGLSVVQRLPVRKSGLERKWRVPQ